MKNNVLLLFSLINIMLSTKAFCQTPLQIDLSDKKASSQQIDLNVTDAILINRVNGFTYKTTWKRKTISQPPFELPATSTSGQASVKSAACIDKNVQKALTDFEVDDESKIKLAVQNATQLVDTLSNVDCKDALNERIAQTKKPIDFPYRGTLDYNQVITLEIAKINKANQPIDKWTYTFTTEEKSRWLIHYGLTYAPNIISKVNHYYSFADTSTANKYTITKDNQNGPKPWDNISATINFTYPLRADFRNWDWGATAGFGLNPDLQLSGHAGVSFIIGQNVILGSGIAFMQKYKLKGEYKEGQIVKTNLDFDALHEKVWLPELYFTIGFRFNSNPFGKSNNNSQASNSNTGNTGNTNSTGKPNNGSTNQGNTTTNQNGSQTPNNPKPDSLKINTEKPGKDTTPSNSKPVGFIPTKLNFKNIDNPNFQYSALTVWNNQLLLIPQYDKIPDYPIKSINKNKLFKSGKINSNLTGNDFTSMAINDPKKLLDSIHNKQGWEAATIKGDTIFLAMETDTTEDSCYILKGVIKNNKIYLVKKKLLLGC